MKSRQLLRAGLARGLLGFQASRSESFPYIVLSNICHFAHLLHSYLTFEFMPTFSALSVGRWRKTFIYGASGGVIGSREMCQRRGRFAIANLLQIPNARTC
jgi:hypothetical protein